MIPEFFSATSIDASAAIPAWLDLSAVVVGSLTGVLVAKERDLDLVGYLVLSLLGGLGGGLVRDVVMQVGDVYMLRSPLAIPVSAATGAMGFLFSGMLHRFPRLLTWTDIISVGLFVAAGTGKAMVYGLSPWACFLMGSVTGVGGGMLRDITLGETPKIFRRSNLYAICALLGSIAYYLLISVVHVSRVWTVVISVALVVLSRMWSLRYNVLSPAGVDLTPSVSKAARVVYTHARGRGEKEGESYIRRHASHALRQMGDMAPEKDARED